MSASRIEPALLAAMLEGTATPAERELVLRLIADSPDAYTQFQMATELHDAFHDSVALDAATDRDVQSEAREVAERTLRTDDRTTQEHPAKADQPTVTPRVVRTAEGPMRAASTMLTTSDTGTRTSRFRILMPVAILAAAGIAIVMLTRTASPNPAPNAIAIAQGLRVAGAQGSGSLARTIGADWDVPGWTVARGGETQLATPARAFRAGVRLGQLEIAANSRDTTAAINAMRELQALLSDVPGFATVAAQLDPLTTQYSQDARGSRLVLADQIRTLSQDTARFDLGVWIAAAQTAVRARDMTFFVADGSQLLVLRRILESGITLQDDNARRAFDAMRDLAQRGASQTEGTLNDVRITLTRVASAAGE